MNQRLKVGLDIDDTIVDFFGEYLKRFGTPKADHHITKNVQKLRKDKQFWENLPKLRDIDFIPTLYCTKRINSKAYTKNSLIKHGFPLAPIYQMYYQHGDKATMIKGKTDVFIDDSISNFQKMNKNGVFCLLITAPHNLNFETDLRIDDLNYETILNKYNQHNNDNTRRVG
jgi:5'(3')-deoxyribonucleotidase